MNTSSFTNRRFLLIGIFLVCAFAFRVPMASAATLNLVTDAASYNVGDTFDLNVKIDSAGQGINGAQATITFDPAILAVATTSTADSIFDFWLTRPTIGTGQVNFIAAATIGFTGQSLQVARITFKVKTAGKTDIAATDAAVTAADGSGNNVLSSINNASLTLSAATGTASPSGIRQIVRTAVSSPVLPAQPVIMVPLYPDPARWYGISAGYAASWNLPADIVAVATAVDQVPSTTPAVGEGLFDGKDFPRLSDGVWYLHVRFKNNNGWGPVATYRLAVDTTPPAAFMLKVAEGLSTTNPTPHLSYATGDALSGIDHYAIAVDDTNIVNTTDSVYTLAPLLPGTHTVTVSAFDRAGNAAVSSVRLQITELPIFTLFGISVTQFGLFVAIILMAAVGGAVGGLGYRLWRRQLNRRVEIAERDVLNAFGTIGADVEQALRSRVSDGTGVDPSHETEFLLKRTREHIEKTKKYIVDDIGDIAS